MKRGRGIAFGVMLLVSSVAFVYWSYHAIRESPLMLLLGEEPRKDLGLDEILRLTGWNLPARTRLIHAEHRSWLDETVIAEFELPERDANVLLLKVRQGRYIDNHAAHLMEIPDPPFWWNPKAISPEYVAESWSMAANSDPVRSGICIARRSGGIAKVYLLWVRG